MLDFGSCVLLLLVVMLMARLCDVIGFHPFQDRVSNPRPRKTEQPPSQGVKVLDSILNLAKKISKGKLYLILGPMSAGKSRELKRRIDVTRISVERTGKKMIIVRPQKDTRYDERAIVTHSGEMEKDVTLASVLSDLEERVADCDYIFIDEGQFFPDCATQCKKWVKEGKKVYVAALLAYSNGKLWPQVKLMLPYSKVKILEARCVTCGGSATLTKRLDGEDIAETKIGGLDMYSACCIHCE